MTGPPRAVLRAFGITGSVTVLDGGEGLAGRAGDAVLKPVYDANEAAWTQSLLDGLVR